jgi:hypothetical protein
MAKPINYLRTEASFDLPGSITKEIGHIMVRWAFLEHKIQQIIWNLVQVTIPMGRLAIREPRAEDRITLIQQISDLRGISISDDHITKIKSEIKQVSPDRDLLAHGFWFRTANGWSVALTRGKWSDSEPHSKYKSVVPEAVHVTPDALRKISHRIEGIINLADLIARDVHTALKPPPEVHPEQLPRKIQKQNRSPSKPEPQP